MNSYKICAAFDTETCNIQRPEGVRAFVVCYQINDIRTIDLKRYEPDKSDDICIYRHLEEVIEYFESLIEWGINAECVPVVCGYNLMFDLVTLREWISTYEVEVNAQTSTNIYTLDLMDGETPLLRFWDTYHLELNGLAAMGETAGLKKLYGEWDYDLIRAPDTPLTNEEIEYASRDVQVIPAYLRYLLEANSWLTPDMFGFRVITKSSLVRQMARKTLFNMKFLKANGKRFTIGRAFELTCKQEHAKDYRSYGLRKAAFRGGLTFTAANLASIPMPDILSLDVTSMHHLFINGRYIPVHFSDSYRIETLYHMCESILKTDIDQVLKYYHRPFDYAFHCLIRFDNLRLKKGSAFKYWGIGTLASAKFGKPIQNENDLLRNEAGARAEVDLYECGFHDRVKGDSAVAFGKIIAADRCEVFLSEIELYIMGLVYEWDSMEVLAGEATMKFVVPPDYVTLQSNILYEQKNAMKTINKTYVEGVQYSMNISSLIPEPIQKGLKNGSLTSQFVSAYYNSTVKGGFNGIYGTQAQDIMKPSFMWNMGDVRVNPDKLTPENYSENVPKNIKVLFTYGLRIVAGSRLHLVLAIDKLYKDFRRSIDIIGGDTDSLKISLHGVKPDSLLKSLEPLHIAADNAISFTMRRVRRLFPDLTSPLEGIGHFDVESANSDSVTYDMGMESWNKCRITIESGRNHVTMAGVSRPRNTINVETFADMLYKQGIPFEEYAPLLLGYDMYIPSEITHALMKYKPEFRERFIGVITDWLGDSHKIDEYQACALYPCGRFIGDLTKYDNRRNVTYLKARGCAIDTSSKQLRYDSKSGKAFIDIQRPAGIISIG